MSKQMQAVLLLALHFLPGLGTVDGSTCSGALSEDVEQDGEVCLNALQVHKARMHNQEGANGTTDQDMPVQDIRLRENSTNVRKKKSALSGAANSILGRYKARSSSSRRRYDWEDDDYDDDYDDRRRRYDDSRRRYYDDDYDSRRRGYDDSSRRRGYDDDDRRRRYDDDRRRRSSYDDDRRRRSSSSSSKCWETLDRYFCYPQSNSAGGYDDYDTLSSAKYECACSYSCYGVYYNSQSWYGGKAGKYYVCTSSSARYESDEYSQKVYKKGYSVTCDYYQGDPQECY